MEGRAFRDGIGCGGKGGTGPTLVWYLCGAGATTIEAWEAAAASAEPPAGLPWAVAGAAAAVGGGIVAAAATMVGEGAAAAVARPGLDPPQGEDKSGTPKV